MITIINYGLGNLGSIYNMFKKIGVKSVITGDPNEINRAEKIILPGIGHFDRAMEKINQRDFRGIIETKAKKEKVPILGICLGMQLLTNSSEEGRTPGLGLIPAKTIRFKFPKEINLKIPHMGWNFVSRSSKSSLTEGFEEETKFYFVHSYHVIVEDEKYSILKTIHGYSFDSGIQNDNVFGVQFHPEKSHRFGMKLLRNFAKL